MKKLTLGEINIKDNFIGGLYFGFTNYFLSVTT